ncbi:MAG: hypothetical protein V1664_00975 [Candidatus Uhrbacteria bacterium]
MKSPDMGIGSPEKEPKQELPKPLDFEKFISIQKPVLDENGNEIILTEEQKTEIYSAYVQVFYIDLKKEIKYWEDLYSSYVQYFYTSGAGNAYDPEKNPKPMSFDEFKVANQEAYEKSKE